MLYELTGLLASMNDLVFKGGYVALDVLYIVLVVKLTVGEGMEAGELYQAAFFEGLDSYVLGHSGGYYVFDLRFVLAWYVVKGLG